MKKNRAKKTFLLLAGLLVGLNLVLLGFYEESIYKKKAFIEEWSVLPQVDLKETTAAEGVVQPEEKTTVAFDPAQGTYIQTLVEENEKVEKGDPVMEYQIHDYQSRARELESELAKVQAEITAARSTLNELASMTFEEDTRTVSSLDSEADAPEESNSSEEGSGAAAEYMKEEFRLETEQKIASLQAEESTLETQLEELEREGKSLSVTSPVSGTITDIEAEDDGPTITVSSANLVIAGEIPEQTRKKAAEGMAVEISGTETEGKISEIAEYPVTTSAETASSYEFSVIPEDPVEDLLPGYHTALEIILAERLNVPAVHQDQLTEDVVPAVWLMQEDGTVTLRELETGLEMNSWKEIINGANAGQPVVESPGTNLTSEGLFVTTLETRYLNWEQLKNEKAAFLQNYPLLAGLLHR